jgi:hypothetical protein
MLGLVGRTRRRPDFDAFAVSNIILFGVEMLPSRLQSGITEVSQPSAAQKADNSPGRFTQHFQIEIEDAAGRQCEANGFVEGVSKRITVSPGFA